MMIMIILSQSVSTLKKRRMTIQSLPPAPLVEVRLQGRASPTHHIPIMTLPRVMIGNPITTLPRVVRGNPLPLVVAVLPSRQMDARFSQIMDMIMVQGSRSAHSDEKDDDDDEHTAPAFDSWAKDKMTKSFFHSRWFDDQIETPSDSKEQKEAHKEAKLCAKDANPFSRRETAKRSCVAQLTLSMRSIVNMFPSLFVSRKRRLTEPH